jgi:pyruvate formate lyase activating enzyme
MPLSRRQFIKRAFSILFGLGVSPAILRRPLTRPSPAYASTNAREALYYKKLDASTVQCALCPHGCVLAEGRRGFCRARESQGGKLYTLVYELPCAVHVDPIEKKPVYHMLPGSSSFSIATAGCNSRCKYCQNWQISQSPPEETTNRRLTKEEVAAGALNAGCRSISYTYSEPVVFYEYMLDSARLARSKGLKNVMVTGGMIEKAPLEGLSPYIDAANIDLKAFDDAFLRDHCAQNLKSVTEAIITAKKLGIWVELTNLVVPTMNDDPVKIEEMAVWIKENVGRETPLHFSRFWPTYKLKNLPPTPTETLKRARDIAIASGLDYVYIGNIPGHEGSSTYCPSCKNAVIRRKGYLVTETNMAEGACRSCGHKIPGIWR